jgi:hypothetical protein
MSALNSASSIHGLARNAVSSLLPWHSTLNAFAMIYCNHLPLGVRDAEAAATVLPADHAQGLRTIGDPVIRR